MPLVAAPVPPAASTPRPAGALPLHFQPATELAARIRAREVTAVELVHLHLDRIHRHHPALNAVVTLDEDRARRRAKEADEALSRGEVWGPLHGVPMTIKDGIETAGLRTTGSYKAYADHVPAEDATVVARLRAAGAILLGKTNLPMMSGDMQCNSPLFGRTNNPWDLSRTPGGSTGGGAAAIAAGLSPLEIGTDLGGSVRIPAHFCGIYSLKPTEHRVSIAGLLQGAPGVPGFVRHCLTAGPLARSVADLRLALELIAGPDGRQRDVPPVPLGDGPPRDIATCRVAWSDDIGGHAPSEETRAAMRRAADALTAAGCHVEERPIRGLDWEQAWSCWPSLGWADGVARSPWWVAWMMRGMGGFGDVIQRGMGQAAKLDLRGRQAALATRDRLLDAVERFLAGWDAWLCPTSLIPAFPHQRSYTPIRVDGRRESYMIAAGGPTCVFNVTGNPVVVIPAGRTPGLPIGIQVVGRLWGDMETLAVAEAISGVLGGFEPPPGF